MNQDERKLAIADFNAKQDAILRNPTAEAALAWWAAVVPEPPVDPSIPLATVHKARLQWLDATDAMLAESAAWLTANDYSTTWQGAPPLTPEQRDADRATLGKPPLAGGGP